MGFDQPGVVNRAAEGARHNDYFRGIRLESLVHTIRRIAHGLMADFFGVAR